MKNTILSIVAVFSTAGYTMAEEAAVANPVTLTGEIKTTIAETAADKYGATTTFGLDVGVTGIAFGGLNFATGADDKLALDEWHIGANLGLATVSYGDQGNNWIGAEGEQTIADPAMGDSLKVSVGDATVALGMTDATADVTDLSNVQATYTMGVADDLSLTGAVDYNLDSETTILGASLGGIDLGVATASGAFTYGLDSEAWGYEGVVATGGLTAYINGDNVDALQNIGGGYDMTIASGLELGAGVSYNMNSEEFKPSVSASFSF
jgi:hypothetical protein|tara:strand:+ start:359 stop:1156 length:798 start_codon:yes stop_codon:yes gene_type:complete